MKLQQRITERSWVRTLLLAWLTALVTLVSACGSSGSTSSEPEGQENGTDSTEQNDDTEENDDSENDDTADDDPDEPEELPEWAKEVDRYLYVLNPDDNQIHVFDIDRQSGALQEEVQVFEPSAASGDGNIDKFTLMANDERLVVGANSTQTDIRALAFVENTDTLQDMDPIYGVRHRTRGLTAHPNEPVIYSSRGGGSVHRIVAYKLDYFDEPGEQFMEHGPHYDADEVGQLNSLQVHPSGDYLYTGSSGSNELHVLELDADGTLSESPTQVFEPGINNERVADISPSGDTLLIVHNGGQGLMFLTIDPDEGTLSELALSEGGFRNYIRGAEFHPNGQWAFAIYGTAGELAWYALDRSEQTATPVEYIDLLDELSENHPGQYTELRQMSVSPDGSGIYVNVYEEEGDQEYIAHVRIDTDSQQLVLADEFDDVLTFVRDGELHWRRPLQFAFRAQTGDEN